MRLWFAPHSEVPIYRQLVTQVVLAILSGDLKPGERLPSTRALARRFAIHPNTVSAGYRQLEAEGWVESRRGSGVYVRESAEPVSTPEEALDYHIAGFFRALRESGLEQDVVKARVAAWLEAPQPDHFVVVDPDAKVRQILMAELRGMTSLAVKETPVEGCTAKLAGAIPVCRPSKTRLVREALPAGVELLTLPINSAPAWLTPWLKQTPDKLVAVVSHWPEFLEIARTMLLAAGFPAEGLMFREAGKKDWRRGLELASAILCDAYTDGLAGVPKGPRRLVFPLLAEQTRELLAGAAGL